MQWRRDAVRVVVLGTDQQVVRDALPAATLACVAAVIPVVTASDAESRAQLVLDLGREIPVGVALAVAAQDLGIPARRVRVVLTEVAVADRAALPVDLEVAEVAVRHEVASARVALR